jgi:Uma2 family endonuclease
VPLIWVIHPQSRKVLVYRDDGSANRLLECDELSGEDVIPGFRCPVRELFPRREPLPEKVEPTATGSDPSQEQVS